MHKSTVRPEELERACHELISVYATVAGSTKATMSGAFGSATEAQIGMIVSLGKVFGIALSDVTAEDIALAGLVRVSVTCPIASESPEWYLGGGRTRLLTELLGRLVAEDFYRMSNGEESLNLIENEKEKLRFSKKG